MGVPTSEVGYNFAMPRREDHEVRQGHVGALGRGEKKSISELESTPEESSVNRGWLGRRWGWWWGRWRVMCLIRRRSPRGGK